MPVQTPASQVSVCVQAFPSSHDAPSGLVGFEQAPVVGSQTPASWQASDATQTTGVPGTQLPAAHWSAWVQALPSSQGALLFVRVHLPALQVSASGCVCVACEFHWLPEQFLFLAQVLECSTPEGMVA